MAFPKPKRTVLDNGLRVVVVPMKDNPTVTVEVLVEAGSHYESPETNGISHFLEHLCFKGTPSRPTAGMISHELEALGAQSNAFTGEECTGYYAKARTKHFEHILEILSDVYLNPTFPSEEIQKEKGVIIEEINMYEDLPQVRVGELLDALVYGDQPAGLSILGPKENILRFDRNDVVGYREKHYVPQKTVVVVSGGVDTKTALSSVKKYFEHLPQKKEIRKKKVRENSSGPAVATRYKKTEQSHFVLGFRSMSLAHADHLTAKLLGAVLGAGSSSRLFLKLREEMGVCYYVGAKQSAATDTGIFAIRAGVDNSRLEEVISIILEEVRRLSREDVPARELKKTKELLLGSIAMDLESSDALADWYGTREILRRGSESPEELSRRIKNVTASDIRRVAQKIFKDERMNLAVIGPVRSGESLKKILHI